MLIKPVVQSVVALMVVMAIVMADMVCVGMDVVPILLVLVNVQMVLVV